MPRPNVILILTDDQGWGDLSRSGNTNISTPHIDQLAADGAILDQFFVQPLCAPTRAEILTGRCYRRTGVKGVSLGAERLNLDEVTIADLFKAQGYKTGCFGKWHSGQQYPYHPNGRGFEEFKGYCCGHWSHYFDSTIEHNGIEFKSEGYLTDALTNFALDYITANKDTPFFCYLPLNTPHSPFQVPDAYFNTFANHPVPLRATAADAEVLDKTRAALAMCENIDWNVGRVLDHLKETGLENDTIVIFLSDNGPNGHRWNGEMTGIKGQAEEGGVRSPCSITWPGHIPEGLIIDRIAGSIDLLPTLADFCGVEITGNKPLDGISLVPLLTGTAGPADWPDRLIFAREANSRGTTSVRDQHYRAGGNLGGLYHMSSDIGQANDLSLEKPELYQKLMGAIADWKQELPVTGVYSALPVGFDEFPHAYIPTQDASLSGGLNRSSVHPNCSFIIDWEDPAAIVTWDLDVVHSGEYEVTLMYACPEHEIGSTIEVRCEDSRVTVQLSEAFNPPLLDQDDRYPRDESYEKAFKPLVMGTLKLGKGQRELVMTCVEKAGRIVGEVRALKLLFLG